MAPVVLTAVCFPRRKNFAVRTVLSSAAIVGVQCLMAFFINLYAKSGGVTHLLTLNTVRFFLMYLMSGAWVAVCFETDIWGALFCANNGYCVQHISARVHSVITDCIVPGSIVGGWSDVLGLALAAVFCAAYYFFAVRVLRKKRQSIMGGHSGIIVAVVVVASSIYYNSVGISHANYVITYYDIALGREIVLFVYIMSTVVAFLAMTVNFGISMQRNLEYESVVLKNLIAEQKNAYERDRQNMEMLNVKLHDVKHHIRSLKGEIYDGEIAELDESLEIYDSNVRCGNEVLDTLFTQKAFYCNRNGIKLTVLIDGEKLSFVRDHELYILMCNALDTAVCGVKNLPPEKRVISVTSSARSGFVNITVENYFDGTLDIKDGLPVTNKTGVGHGYGMKSMKLIAEKYDGTVKASTRGDTFVLDIMLCNNK